MGRLPTNAGLRSVVVDSQQPKRVYVASDAGIARSDDAGETWTVVGNGVPEGAIVALALDPRAPQRLYAASAAGALLLSEDGATSWRTVATAVPAPGA